MKQKQQAYNSKIPLKTKYALKLKNIDVILQTINHTIIVIVRRADLKDH